MIYIVYMCQAITFNVISLGKRYMVNKPTSKSKKKLNKMRQEQESYWDVIYHSMLSSYV